MLLAMDIGNTNITLGCYADGALLFTSRVYSEKHRTADEYATMLMNIFHLHAVSGVDFRGAILSSVVPELTDLLFQAVKTVLGKAPLIVGEDVHDGFLCDILPVGDIGADLIVDTVAAKGRYPLPCLVADLGTATKIIAIDKDGKFLGCTIAPGVKISLDALAAGTALLPAISFTMPEHAIGTNTIECMRSGSVFGTAAMLDGMVDRITAEMGEETVSLVATGGLGGGIVPCCKKAFRYDRHLLLDGLKMIYEAHTARKQ